MAKRQTLRLLCAAEDRPSLQPILDALRTRGIGVSEDPKGKGTLLAALSERLYADENLRKTLLEAVSSGAESVLPLRLDKAELPPEIQTALYARNIIPADERSAEQTAGRIAAALPEKKRPTGRLLIAGAVVLALLAALLIWRAIPREQPEPAAPTAVQENLIPEGWGLSEADLAYIRSVVIIGDEYHFLNAVTPQPGDPVPSVFDYAVDNPDGDGWYSKADGSEYRLTRYDDLRFLALMPKLQSLSFALVDLPQLPDLSGTQLKYVEFFDCTIDRLDWFDAEKLQSATIDGCPLTDLSPLSATTQQLDAHIGFGDGTSPDLSGFHPQRLGRLELSGSPREIRMPDLSLCESVNELILRNLPIENLDFLKGGKVYRLTLDDCSRLRNLSGLAGQAYLRELRLHGCRQLRDYGPIGSCPALEQLLIDTWEDSGVTDLSFLEGLTRLQDIQLHGCTVPDLNFLRQYAGRPAGLSFGFRGSCGDLSALGELSNYKYLDLNVYDHSFSEAAALLADARIDDLEVHHMGAVDLSAIPPKTMHLQLESCTVGSDLSALPEISLTQLELRSIPELRSLKGLQNLARFGENGTGVLKLFNCPRLTDFGELDGMMLDGLELRGVYALPDFGSFTFHALKLDSLDWVEDLKFLDSLDQSYQGYQKFSLPGME